MAVVASCVSLLHNRHNDMCHRSLLQCITFLAFCLSTAVSLDWEETPLPTLDRDPLEVWLQSKTDESAARIVGGGNANRRRFPYYTWITWFDLFQNPINGCGGTLIAPDIVLSATHCRVPGASFAIAAVNYTSHISDTGFEKLRFVTNQITNPGYLEHPSGALANDIMLVELEEPVNDVPLIRLNTRDNVPSAGQVVTAIGMGRLEQDGRFPNTLQIVRIPTIGFQVCNNLEFYEDLILDPIMICAGADFQVSFFV